MDLESNCLYLRHDSALQNASPAILSAVTAAWSRNSNACRCRPLL